MKTSGLIKRLQEVLDRFGDTDVYVGERNGAFVETIDVNFDEVCVVQGYMVRSKGATNVGQADSQEG